MKTGSHAVRTWVGTGAKVVRHVRVLGEGHLAAATRSELDRLGIHRDTDYLLPSLAPPLVIACGDSEVDESFNLVARHVSAEGSPLLLACLLGRCVRIGPLIETTHERVLEIRPPRNPAPAQLERSCHDLAAPVVPRPPVRVAEAPQVLYARLGALLVSAQTLSFLLGARNQCVLDRVVELNPWSMESKSYKVLKVRQ